MRELAVDQYDSVRELFAGDLPNRPIMEAVLAGRAPGSVFVDDPAAPTAAVCNSQYGWSHLGGAVKQSLLDEAARAVRRRRVFELIVPFDGLGELSPPAGYKSAYGRIHFDQLEPTWETLPSLPAGLTFEPMTESLLAQCRWAGEIAAEFGRDDVARFFEVGFGWCIMAERKVVGEAYASMTGDAAYEIGPIVDEHYRRRGVAYALCAKLIDTARQRGMGALWSCNDANQASAQLARKLGYRRERPYTIYHYRPLRESS